MKKLFVLGLVLLMVVIFGTAALAMADVQKLLPYPFTPSGTPMVPLCPDASGKAIVNDSMGDVVLEITVSVIGLEPDTEYVVKSCTSWPSGPWIMIGEFTTNANGNGHFHLNFRADETLPETTEHIYINIKGTSNTVLMDEDFDLFVGP